ncbi:MAG: carboxypeptidase-like regulatory domain-containing protein [Phocaeicola vulgatus]
MVDETGETVIGASVVVEGTTNGTITDFDGKFTLNVPERKKS